MPTPSLARTLKSIQNLVDDKEWYSAHQKYRTSAARLIKANNLSDAASLLYEGSRLLLERDQAGSGTDLALMLIKSVYSAPDAAARAPYTPEVQAKLLHLIVLAGTAGTWRKSITDAALSMSAEAGGCPTGDPGLHASVGELLAKEGDLHQASYHLLAACSRDAARTLADVMFIWSREETSKGPAHLGCLGRYAARGVLGYLELGSVLPARVFLDEYLSKCATAHPSLVHSTIPSTVSGAEFTIQLCTVPSLNFLQLLVLTCQVGAGGPPSKPGAPAPASSTGGPQVGKAAYQAMIGRYSRSVAWLATEGAKESLAVIAKAYIGIQPPRQGGLLGDLMGSLFGGGAPGGAPAPGKGRGRSLPSSTPATPGLD